jgi:glycosyltransferase involved in cell wall biosynthesis
VLPTYNGEKYLRQSVDSIINQTYKEWELIIVDDCSTDNTYTIASEYSKKDNRISVIHNVTNQKTPTSLNIGFKHARGDLFTWTSDDNVFMPEALDILHKELTNDASIDLVFSNYSVIDPDDYILLDIKTGPKEDIFRVDTIGACFLYKREVHETLNGYNKDKYLVEDYDFGLRAYEKFEFKHIDKSLYYYRIHNSSLSANKRETIIKAAVKLLEEHYQNIPTGSKKLRHEVISNITKYYWDHKKYSKAFKYCFIKYL